MAAERNFFHRWRGMTTIGYELGVIWEMSVKTGDREMTIAALAVLSGMKVDSVRTVISNRSAKGMVSISWKAGLSAGIAEILQKNLTLIPPTEIIRADDGRYPLEEDDMEWQLDFIMDLS